MNPQDDLLARLRQMLVDIPRPASGGLTAEGRALADAIREIETLRNNAKTPAKVEVPAEEPQFFPRATKKFTPVEAADFLEESLAENLRAYPNEHEAFRTLFAAVRPPAHGKPQKLRIYINRKVADVATPNKIAAHAVHAALTAFGVHPGVKVVVLDKGPTVIKDMRVVIHDAGHTELAPGTLTAGTNWPQDSEE